MELEKAFKRKKAGANEAAQEPTRYLFDMEADPYQMKPLNVNKAENPVAAELSAKLRTWLEAHNDPFAKCV